MKTDKILETATFEWYSLIKDLLRSFWAIILAALIMMMGINVIEKSVYTPSYTSEAVLVVHTKVGTSGVYDSLSASAELAEIFTKVFEQPTLQKLAAEHLGYESFNGTIKVTLNEDTNLLNIAVQSADPILSFKLLSAVLEVYPNVSEFVFTNAVIDIMHPPKIPTSPSNFFLISHREYFILGAMVLVAGLVVLFSMLRETVKEEKGFSKIIDAKLLGTISHEKDHLSFKEKLNRKKRAMLINDAYASVKFIEDNQKLANKLENIKKKRHKQVFAITSIAENEGKSTVAANLALSLSERGHRVALIDMDIRKPSMYKIFGHNKELEAEFADVLSGKVELKRFKFFRNKNGNLIIAFNKHAHTETFDIIDTNILEKCVDILKEQVDFVIIDTSPASVSADAMAISKISDSTLLVIRTDVVLIQNINEQILTLSDAGCDLAGCILNDVHKPFTLFGSIGFSGTEELVSSQRNYSKYERKAPVQQTNDSEEN